MSRSWLGPAVIAALAFGVLLAGVLAVMQLLPAGKPRPTPTAVSTPSRQPAGMAAGLTLAPGLRSEVLAATGTTPEAKADGAAKELFYGVVYGSDPTQDVYYLAAGWAPMRLWTRPGVGEWTYKGDFQPCGGILPTTLTEAWKLESCRR
ncbi:hypothetical protein ACIBG8_42055 [Nonomuraea sp. NPDC050556]|uniref:hypothetical protein n=1 Tax=Nonomuraea sp. NPDC050556 TaxID=3364369 RepID=UPI0037ADD6CD